MEMNEKIRMLRKKNNLTLEEVGNVVGVGKSTVRKWENGDIANMRRDKIALLAKALHTTPAYLMDWKPEKSDVTPYNDKETVKINIYGNVPAGVPIEAIEETIGEEDIPREWLKGGQEYIALKVSGDSMYPKYLDGDIVVIKLQPDCESGQDAVVYINGYDATLKTVIKQDDGMIRLQPANPEYQPKTFYSDNVGILGVVKRLRRDF